ncbi:MAG TPA: MEDS domain-containing protein [Candidatus Baltobacteraceae bacterium]|jgi:hypothetical protein
MSVCQESLDALRPSDHAVQFYGLDEQALAVNVSRYLSSGFQRGEGAVVIARPAHLEAFKTGLDAAGHDTEGLVADGILQLFDAEQTLDRFMVGGQPDAARFDSVIGTLIRAATVSSPGPRAYGEMVGLLWDRGHYPAAIRLEQLWHRLLSENAFTLFCAYEIDLLSSDLELGLLDALFRAHSHLLPSGTSTGLSAALELAMRDVLGSASEDVMREAATFSRRGWSRLPQTEALVLVLRKSLPGDARKILARAKEYYLAYPPDSLRSSEAAM